MPLVKKNLVFQDYARVAKIRHLRVNMTHNEMVKKLLRDQPYVPIKDLRGWCNYRSRITDCRADMLVEGYTIESFVVGEGKAKFHAYRLVPIYVDKP
jgi:uncharacterized protein VirK/YbjX